MRWRPSSHNRHRPLLFLPFLRSMVPASLRSGEGGRDGGGPDPRHTGVAEQRPSSPMSATAHPSSSSCTSRPTPPPVAHVGEHYIDVAHDTLFKAGLREEGSPGRETSRACADDRSSCVGGRSSWSICCLLTLAPHRTGLRVPAAPLSPLLPDVVSARTAATTAWGSLPREDPAWRWRRRYWPARQGSGGGPAAWGAA